MTESEKERAERVGDPKLQAAYRALGAEEPPRALDEAILGAARDAAQPWTKRWAVPLSLAAVVVLSVAVTLRIQHEQPGIESPAPAYKPSTPAAKDAAPAATQDAQLARKKEEPAMAAAERAAALPKSTTRSEAEAFPSSARNRAVAESRVAEAAPAAAPAPLMEAPALAKRADGPPEVGSAAGSVAAPPAPAAAAPAMGAMQRERTAGERAAAPTPEKELERIADLRKQGLHDEADKALAEFRKRYPDYKLTEAMRERVERR
jgi:hypothetical protein